MTFTCYVIQMQEFLFRSNGKKYKMLQKLYNINQQNAPDLN